MQAIFNERFGVYCPYIEKSLDEYVMRYCNYKTAAALPKAMLYSLKAGGKRIRPILALEICRMLCGDYELAKSSACAIEMIHTFSLIHDDLPAMDDDDLRRGKPSCHKAFGEANAILAGDALAALPYIIIADDEKLDSCCKSKLALVLASETADMIAGQVIDVENEGKTIGKEILLELYSKKTCALLKACCKMGAICANADESIINRLEEYAEYLGLAFQIIDDILDIVGDEKTLGKLPGSDAVAEKTTYATLVGVENARNKALELTQKALCVLDDFENCDFLKQLTKYLLERNS